MVVIHRAMRQDLRRLTACLGETAATAGQAVDLTPLADDHQALEAAGGQAGQALGNTPVPSRWQATPHAECSLPLLNQDTFTAK